MKRFRIGYFAKRAVYDSVRTTIRAADAAQRKQMAIADKDLADQFVGRLEQLPPTLPLGYIDLGAGERRAITPENFEKLLEAAHSGDVPLVLVENGEEQIVSPAYLKLIRSKLKARAKVRAASKTEWGGTARLLEQRQNYVGSQSPPPPKPTPVASGLAALGWICIIITFFNIVFIIPAVVFLSISMAMTLMRAIDRLV
jgi:hypothetical protein